MVVERKLPRQVKSRIARRRRTARTRWDIVTLALAAGYVVGMQVGKVPPVLPILEAELGLSRVIAGLIASSFSHWDRVWADPSVRKHGLPLLCCQFRSVPILRNQIAIRSTSSSEISSWRRS